MPTLPYGPDNPHPLSQMRTELIWQGKYDAHGRRAAPLRLKLPFQTVETVNEDPKTRQLQLDLFNASRPSDWRNRLIWGDKKYVLPALLDEFAGRVNLIYIDPPFNVGADFSFTASIPPSPLGGGAGGEGELGQGDLTFLKEPSILEQKAYRDTWGRGLDSYLQWLYETILLLYELLAEDGSIYVHLDWHVAHYAKAVLDEIYSYQNYQGEIIWQKLRSVKSQSSHYANIHDIILIYTKSQDFVFNPQYVDKDAKLLETHYRHTDPETGRRYNLADFTQAGSGPARRFGDVEIAPPAGKHWIWSQERIDNAMGEGLIVFSKGGLPYVKRFFDDSEGTRVGDIWVDINPINQVAKERLDYPTQKPEALLERIIKASSNEGDLVLDCFCGSGTTPAVAEKLGRRWIACDLGRFAIHTARKRLLSIENVKPFVVQNLGKYERQAWQAAQFGDPQAAALVARGYQDFILQLYHARPLQGYTWLHGLKAGRMVHVGPVDAPITPADVTQIAIEFRKAVGTGAGAPQTAAVDVLGWDFAFELNEVARQQADQARIAMRFIRIPREVLEEKAVQAGDIRFFELAALAVEVQASGRSVTLQLTDFVIPPDDVPEEIQRAVSHWSQWIDYWAVDWDYQGDAFHNTWQAYRTRKDKTLRTRVEHTYPQPGEYRILVKVIDILGNDTTKALAVTIS